MEARLLLDALEAGRLRTQKTMLSQPVVSIATQQTLAVSFLPRWWRSLGAAAADIRMNIVADNLFDMVDGFRNGHHDLLLTYELPDLGDALNGETLKQVQVGSDCLMPVMSAGYASQHDYLEVMLRCVRYFFRASGGRARFAEQHGQ